MTARIEVREETHPDVVRHVHPRHVQMIVVPLSNGLIAEARANLLHLLRDVINKLISLKVKHHSQTAPSKFEVEACPLCSNEDPQKRAPEAHSIFSGVRG